MFNRGMNNNYENKNKNIINYNLFDESMNKIK